MTRRYALAVALCVAMSAGATSRADTAQFQEGVLPTGAYVGCADSHIRRRYNAGTVTETDTHFWSSDMLNVRTRRISEDPDSYEQERAVISFDISSIPAGSKVTSATLRLWTLVRVRTVLPNWDLVMHPVVEAWTETQVTWNKRTTVLWTTPGGDIGPFVTTSAVAVDDIVVNDWLELDVPVSVVQPWVDAPANNHGLLLKTEPDYSASTVGDIELKFASSQHATDDQRPMFVVTYTLPDPPGKATNPSPADGATGVSRTPTLSWTAGARAVSHEVYFGAASPLVAGDLKSTQTTCSYAVVKLNPYVPPVLDPLTQYFWRIDEVDALGRPSTTGDEWDFTVGNPDSDIDGTFDDADTDDDDDGLLDVDEVSNNTNPIDPDTDNDGHTDKEEVDAGTDPLNPNDPAPPSSPSSGSSGCTSIGSAQGACLAAAFLALALAATGRARAHARARRGR